MVWNPSRGRRVLSKKSSNNSDRRKIPLNRASWPLVSRLVREHVRPHLGRIAFSLVCMAIAAAATAAMAKIMEPMLDDIFKDRDFDALHNIAMIILAVFVNVFHRLKLADHGGILKNQTDV